MTDTPQGNTEEQTAPLVKLDIIALPSEEKNPVKRAFEQTVKIEWTPAELIQELVRRRIIVEKLKKEAKGILSQVAPHQKHIEHLERILNLPDVKVLVDAEPAYLESTSTEEKPTEESTESTEESKPE